MDGLPYPAQGNIIDAEELKSQGGERNLLQIVLSRRIASHFRGQGTEADGAQKKALGRLSEPLLRGSGCECCLPHRRWLVCK